MTICTQNEMHDHMTCWVLEIAIISGDRDVFPSPNEAACRSRARMTSHNLAVIRRSTSLLRRPPVKHSGVPTGYTCAEFNDRRLEQVSGFSDTALTDSGSGCLTISAVFDTLDACIHE